MSLARQVAILIIFAAFPLHAVPKLTTVQDTSFIDFQTPGRVVDGSNFTFTLANTPDPDTSHLPYRNSPVQQAGLDSPLRTTVRSSSPQPPGPNRRTSFGSLTTQTPVVQLPCSRAQPIRATVFGAICVTPAI